MKGPYPPMHSDVLTISLSIYQQPMTVRHIVSHASPTRLVSI